MFFIFTCGILHRLFIKHLFKFLKFYLRYNSESISSQRRAVNRTQRLEVTKIYQVERHFQGWEETKMTATQTLCLCVQMTHMPRQCYCLCAFVLLCSVDTFETSFIYFLMISKCSQSDYLYHFCSI